MKMSIFSMRLLLGKWKDFEWPNGFLNGNVTCAVACARLGSGEELRVGLGAISISTASKGHTV